MKDAKVGEAAQNLFDDAQVMLKRIIAERWIEPRAVIGFWPANSALAMILNCTPMIRAGNGWPSYIACASRCTVAKGKENFCLADYIAPKETGIADYLGGFAVTAGHGVEKIATDFQAAQDDYSSIMVKALADRFAEAFAEHMHAQVRKHFWGYAPDETLDNAALIAEAYRGIRPAPGYPACPDHTEKRTLFDLLKAEKNAGIQSDGELRHVACGLGQRLLFQPSGMPLFWRWPH